ncbi:MAG: ParA family protein [Rhodobacteraceae bacterium]|nr:ParA family protein [Paracoccaceae bacterium]
MLLAEKITVSGGRVAILDLDPNANIRSRAQSREADGKDVQFAVHARPQGEDTVELIDFLAGETDYLIVDLEGSKDQIVTFALRRTDLYVIPLDGSTMEARQAAQAVRLLQTTGNMIRREINHILLFTHTNAAFQTSDQRDVGQELAESAIPVLPVRFAKRAPYMRVFRENVLLSELHGIVTQKGRQPPCGQRRKNRSPRRSRMPRHTRWLWLIFWLKGAPNEWQV